MFVLTLKDEERFEKAHCCDQMTRQVSSAWAMAESPLLGSTDQRVYWSPAFDEYGLICQPSAEILLIQFCPFCGAKLPESKRDAWFSELKRTGWKDWGDAIPKEMLSHDWDEP
jgi:hypothetical protein